MTWFLIPNSPDPDCGNRKVEKKRRRAVLSQVSYCAPQLKPPHLTDPLMSSKCCSVFLPQQISFHSWNFMECQDSEPAGSCCAEMPPSCGYDQAVTKRSASSNISRPANLRARETHRENPQRNPSSALPSLGSRFFQQKVKHFHTASFSVHQWHCAVRLLCQVGTTNSCLGAPPRLFPIERLFSSAGGTEQHTSSCQNIFLYSYLAMYKMAIPLAFIHSYSETAFFFFF